MLPLASLSIPPPSQFVPLKFPNSPGPGPPGCVSLQSRPPRRKYFEDSACSFLLRLHPPPSVSPAHFALRSGLLSPPLSNVPTLPVLPSPGPLLSSPPPPASSPLQASALPPFAPFAPLRRSCLSPPSAASPAARGCTLPNRHFLPRFLPAAGC